MRSKTIKISQLRSLSAKQSAEPRQVLLIWIAVNCYHLYPAGAAFGGYKQSGFGRETHKIILEHYQQTKNLPVSYSPKAMGFF